MAALSRKRKRESLHKEEKEPLGRWRAFSFVHKDHFYVCQGDEVSEDDPEGYSADQVLPLQRYDFAQAQWRGVSPISMHDEEEERFTREFVINGGVCCAVLGDCAYTFGGRWDCGGAMHELNLETMIWRSLECQNTEDGPMHTVGAGMVVCGDEALCVFGGLEYTEFGQVPDFTNDLHLFHVATGRSVLHKKSEMVRE